MPALPKPAAQDVLDVSPKARGGRFRSLLQTILLVLGAAALAAAGFGGGWFYSSRTASPMADALRLIERGETAAPQDAETGKPQKVPREKPETDVFATSYYAFDEPLTTNLAGSQRYLQIGITVSTQYDASVMTHVETHKAALRSDMLAVVGSFTEEQLTGRDGREALAVALRDAINDRLVKLEGFGGVEGVFFTSFVLQ